MAAVPELLQSAGATAGEVLARVGTVGLPVLLGITAVGQTIKCFKLVRKGQVAVQVRGGNPYNSEGEAWGVCGPGIYFRLAALRDWIIVTTALHNDSIPVPGEQFLVDRMKVDGTQRFIGSTITWRALIDDLHPESHKKFPKRTRGEEVDHAILVATAAENEAALRTAVLKSHCQPALREVLEVVDIDKLKSEGRLGYVVNGAVIETVREPLKQKYGVAVEQVALDTVAETSPSMIRGPLNRIAEANAGSAAQLQQSIGALAAVLELHPELLNGMQTSSNGFDNSAFVSRS